ncbi:hypothetical protein LOK49_LG08G02276 [Camellia lanceoleosa]|uniref:Uncharacterized protein n=1 Tax=Camellia lanceoleosa TaxID=1840588 RepID=A0ACC0GNL9_9ERIC|nr:hypothetical protein LOK49_LG08G02276 [Camellia lanceoleosa]
MVWGLCNQTPQLKTPISWRQSNQVSSSVTFTMEPVHLSGCILLKGRVSTQEVFHLSNSNLVPGKYEGELKLGEGSLDLVKTLQSEVQDGRLLLTGKRVLEQLAHISTNIYQGGVHRRIRHHS